MLTLGHDGRFKIEEPERLLATYEPSHVRGGPSYYAFKPSTSADVLVPEDLAATIALSGGARNRAFVSLVERTPFSFDLADTTLERSSDQVVRRCAELLAEVCDWSGFGVSLASKMLHPKRPGLIPPSTPQVTSMGIPSEARSQTNGNFPLG